MLDCTSNLLFICTAECHICDEVRDDAHLFLLFFLLHQAYAIRVAFRDSISSLRVKVFQVSQCSCRFDSHLAGNGDSNDSITIEICTRQALCNFGVDTDGILNIAEVPLATDILVVDRDDRNLESARMRIANQRKLSAVLISRAVALFLADFGQGQDDLSRLTRERRSLQCH